VERTRKGGPFSGQQWKSHSPLRWKRTATRAVYDWDIATRNQSSSPFSSTPPCPYQRNNGSFINFSPSRRPESSDPAQSLSSMAALTGDGVAAEQSGAAIPNALQYHP